MSNIEAHGKTQRIIVLTQPSLNLSENEPQNINPVLTSVINVMGISLQTINARPNSAVSIINAGPQGPPGPASIVPGPTGPQGPEGGPPGPQGPPGQNAPNSFLEFNQGSPSSLWVIAHNLGFNPNVSVVDSAGTEVDGLVRYTSSGSILEIEFTLPFGGKAYLS